MNTKRGKVESLAYGLIGYSAAVEAEKTLGSWVLREHLSEPLNWPLIYGSNFLPGIAAFYGGMLVAKGWELSGASQPVLFDKNAAKAVAYMALGGAVAMPVVGVTTYELKDRCDITQEAPNIVNACAPDTIDATLVASGGVICAAGGALYWRRKNPLADMPPPEPEIL